MKKQELVNKKKLIRESNHLTRPPRLEGVVKNAMMYSPRKKTKAKILVNDKKGTYYQFKKQHGQNPK